jgi:hypothetical protein
VDAVWLFLIILSLPAWWLYAKELFIMDRETTQNTGKAGPSSVAET